MKFESLSHGDALAFLQARLTSIRNPVKYMAGFRTASGRQLGLVGKTRGEKVSVYVETDNWPSIVPGLNLLRRYTKDEPRIHSLRSHAPRLWVGAPVDRVQVESIEILAALCDAYEGLTRRSVGSPKDKKEPDSSFSSEESFALDAASNELRQPASVPPTEQSSFESDTRSLKTAEKAAVVNVRYGQGGFRDALFSENSYGEKCWMSGIKGRQLLIASHIKPWSHCKEDPESRGRPDNGLLLSALWDAAFDAGLIGFDFDWKVIASSMLSESARTALNLDDHSALPEKFRTDGRKRYLAYHRENVFEYWNREST